MSLLRANKMRWFRHRSCNTVIAVVVHVDASL